MKYASKGLRRKFFILLPVVKPTEKETWQIFFPYQQLVTQQMIYWYHVSAKVELWNASNEPFCPPSPSFQTCVAELWINFTLQNLPITFFPSVVIMVKNHTEGTIDAQSSLAKLQRSGGCLLLFLPVSKVSFLPFVETFHSLISWVSCSTIAWLKLGCTGQN